jgi:hypothetical protein
MEKGEWGMVSGYYGARYATNSILIVDHRPQSTDHRPPSTAHRPPPTAQPITIYDLLFCVGQWDSRFWILDFRFWILDLVGHWDK